MVNKDKGHKTELMWMIVKKVPKTMAHLNQFPKRSQSKIHKENFHNQKVVIKLEDFDTKDKIAFVVRKYGGFGKFVVMGFGKIINKRYSKRFKCAGKRCKYHPQNQTIVRGIDGKIKSKCRIYSRHQRGWSCYLNKFKIYNWVKVCGLEIVEVPSRQFQDIDYNYKWNKRLDRMKKRYGWFYKGEIKN